MRIAFLAWRDLAHPRAGGSEVVVDRWASGMVSRGHSVTLVAGGPVAPRGYPVVSSGGTYSQYLRAPAIAMTRAAGGIPWLPPAIGFLAGGAFLWTIDKLIPHLHLGFPMSEAEGPKTHWQRSVLLVLAITLHNIPEGLAVGVAVGAVAAGLPESNLAGALALTIGIGIQNFPEGLAVAAPLRREGMSRLKSFWYGQLSGVVEPVAAVIGAAAVLTMRPLLPYALSFAAGAMIYVVVEELIPESQLEKNTDLATIGTLLGFVVMMVLDVALG